jgi:hypothetical protein
MKRRSLSTNFNYSPPFLAQLSPPTMSHQQSPVSRPMPQPPGSSRRRPPLAAPSLARRPGPPNRITSAPPGPATGSRLRDVSLASLLEGVDQVPSVRKRLLPTSTTGGGGLASGAARPGVMQAKIPQRYVSVLRC